MCSPPSVSKGPHRCGMSSLACPFRTVGRQQTCPESSSSFRMSNPALLSRLVQMDIRAQHVPFSQKNKSNGRWCQSEYISFINRRYLFLHHYTLAVLAKRGGKTRSWLSSVRRLKRLLASSMWSPLCFLKTLEIRTDVRLSVSDSKTHVRTHNVRQSHSKTHHVRPAARLPRSETNMTASYVLSRRELYCSNCHEVAIQFWV